VDLVRSRAPLFSVLQLHSSFPSLTPGLWIPLTARRTSCTASRCPPSASAWFTVATSLLASFTIHTETRCSTLFVAKEAS
jgi:hypothetical protein